MIFHTTAEAAEQLGVAVSTITKHARKIGTSQLVHGYLFTEAGIAELRKSLAASKPGRPPTQRPPGES